MVRQLQPELHLEAQPSEGRGDSEGGGTPLQGLLGGFVCFSLVVVLQRSGCCSRGRAGVLSPSACTPLLSLEPSKRRLAPAVSRPGGARSRRGFARQGQGLRGSQTPSGFVSTSSLHHCGVLADILIAGMVVLHPPPPPPAPPPHHHHHHHHHHQHRRKTPLPDASARFGAQVPEVRLVDALPKAQAGALRRQRGFSFRVYGGGRASRASTVGPQGWSSWDPCLATSCCWMMQAFSCAYSASWQEPNSG